MQLRKKLGLLVIATSICASGCASNSTPDTVKVHYYPACHEPLAYLHQRHGGTGKAAAKGALQAGVISGIASAIIGAIAGNISGTGVAVSVGVGSALGGTMGALNRSSVQQREDNQHLAAYLEQIDGNIEGLNIVTAAATVSRQCYNKEFKMLIDGMENGSITAEAAKSRFGEIAAGEEEAAKLLNQPANTAQLQTEFARAESMEKKKPQKAQ